MNFNGILVGSEDPDRLAAFYTKLFGDPMSSEGGYTGWAIGQGYLMVGAHDAVKGKSAHPGRIIWNIETDDVRGNFERFRDAGATVIAEPYGADGEGDEGGLIATLADPDDNYFQLMTPMPEGS